MYIVHTDGKSREALHKLLCKEFFVLCSQTNYRHREPRAYVWLFYLFFDIFFIFFFFGVFTGFDDSLFQKKPAYRSSRINIEWFFFPFFWKSPLQKIRNTNAFYTRETHAKFCYLCSLSPHACKMTKTSSSKSIINDWKWFIESKHLLHRNEMKQYYVWENLVRENSKFFLSYYCLRQMKRK